MRAFRLFVVLLLASCASVAREPASELRVMSYNIHAGKDAQQQHNIERVAALIREAGADVVLLQEVDRRTQRAAGEDHFEMLMRATGMYGAFGKSLDYQGGDYGIAVLSRYPIELDETVPLQVQPPQDRSGSTHEPRVGLHVIVVTPWGPLHVLNTHIDSAPTTTFRHQEVIQLLAHVRDHTGPMSVIFGGDLNARPDTPEIAAITLAFRDSWARCGDGGPGFTFPAHAPDRRIDYLMLRGFDCTSVRVLDSQASDHRPILAILKAER
jgi:endonuclease/exonuclease/phosphatase family metal-dependent hydrolase